MRQFGRQAVRSCLVGTSFAIGVVASSPARSERLASDPRLPIKTYTAANGLAHDTVRRIVPDSRGFLWFCTAQGLSRFDGHSFITYGTSDGLPSISINDLLETSRGVYWVATNGGGVARFNRADAGRFDSRPIRRPEAGEPPRFTVFAVGDDPQTNRVNALYEDRTGRLWAGTDAGLFVLDGTAHEAKFTRVELGLQSRPDRAIHVWAFVEDRHGALWIGTSWGLLRRMPDGRLIHHTIQPTAGADQVRVLLTDRDGRIWIGHGTGLIVFNPEHVGDRLRASHSSRPTLHTAPNVRTTRTEPRTDVVQLPTVPGEAVRYTAVDGLSGGAVRSLLQSSEGQVWIGTLDGLTGFDGQRFRAFTRPNGIPGALALAEDAANNVWIATLSVGVAKLTRHGFSTYSEGEGLIGPDLRIFEDPSGTLYVFGRRIHRFDGGRFTAVRPNLSLDVAEFGAYVTLRDHAGEWWIAGGAGLYRFPSVDRIEHLSRVRPKAIYTNRDGLAGDDVFTMFEDSRGDIWIGRRDPTSLVLTRWERSTGIFHRYSDADGLPAFNRAMVFKEDRSGNVWVGFWTGGVARYRNGMFRLFTATDGWPAGAISALYVDSRGRLWIGSSDGGVGRVDEPTADHPRVVAYTTADGLASNGIACITEDLQGRLYLGFARGVDRLDPVTGRVRHYTAADGLAGNPSTALRDGKGHLWFATSRGVSRLNPALDPDLPPAPPAAFIGGLRIAGASLPISDLGEREISNVVLEPHQSRLQIDFLSVGLSSSVVRYQFRLDGVDSAWSEPTDQRSVTYSHLAPGRYRFMLRAIAADGEVSPTPATVSFTIRPPLWRRWWVLGFGAIAIVGALYAMHRYRVARLLELERVRTRIATDLHDDLGANLSQIAILSEVARVQAGGDEQATARALSRIASLSRASVDAMSEIVWAIDPHRDCFGDLSTRVRRLANELLPPRGIELAFRTAGETEVTMGADVRREAFLVFKEAMNNVVRHAACARVDVTVLVEGRRLQLEVRDNGIGFSPTDDRGGQGIRSMRRRAERVGGRLEITSEPVAGTSVRLIVPL